MEKLVILIVIWLLGSIVAISKMILNDKFTIYSNPRKSYRVSHYIFGFVMSWFTVSYLFNKSRNLEN